MRRVVRNNRTIVTYTEIVELRHLRYFRVVAESGGISASARRLYIAASAISESIKDLEEELGVPLFDRRGRALQLTMEGKAFLEDARRLLDLADQAIDHVRRISTGESGSLRVGFFAGAFGSFAPKLIASFRRCHKGIRLNLVEMLPSQQAEALLNGTIDIGFTRPGPELEVLVLSTQHFQTETLFAVLPKSHKLARSHELQVTSLAGEPFVINERKFSSALYDRILTLCTNAGFSPLIAATASASNGVAALVEAGEGIAILTEIVRSPESSLRFIPLIDAEATIDIVLAWKAENSNAAVKAFLQHTCKK